MDEREAHKGSVARNIIFLGGIHFLKHYALAVDDLNIARPLRSRLSADTQHQLANLMCKNAVDNGLAKAHDIDIDSTVQEANMTYPTDAKNLRKLRDDCTKCRKVLKGTTSQWWCWLQFRCEH